MIDRKIFFDRVRKDPFGGELEQSQVDGLNAILDVWEEHYGGRDQRFLAYSLATTYHETAATMEPIEEYGKGEGQPYGEPDPGTGECYYGRGYVQLTWAENYRIADKELGLWDDRSCYGNPANALLPDIAAQVLFEGMMEGWFRADDLGPHTLGRYFGATANDPYGAREIINGDKAIVPDWSDGLSIGALVADYHHAFLRALETSSSAPILAYIYTLVIRSESPVTIDFLGGPHGS
jgi:putative chitinase